MVGQTRAGSPFLNIMRGIMRPRTYLAKFSVSGRSAPLNPDHGKPHSRERTTNRDNAPAVFPPVISPVLAQPSFFPYPFQPLIDPDRRISPPVTRLLRNHVGARRCFSVYGIRISDTSNLIARCRDSCLVDTPTDVQIN